MDDRCREPQDATLDLVKRPQRRRPALGGGAIGVDGGHRAVLRQRARPYASLPPSTRKNHKLAEIYLMIVAWTLTKPTAGSSSACAPTPARRSPSCRRRSTSPRRPSSAGSTGYRNAA